MSTSSTSALHASECLSATPSTSATPSRLQQTPEDVALHAARLLLEEVAKGGCVDGKHQWMVMLLMALGKEDVSKCLMGDLTAHT